MPMTLSMRCALSATSACATRSGCRKQGDKPNHLVDPDELSGLHRRYLRSAFGIVKSAQKALEQRYMI